jgi:hypothetical protein
MFTQFVAAMPKGSEQPFYRGEWRETQHTLRIGLLRRQVYTDPRGSYRETAVARGWFVPLSHSHRFPVSYRAPYKDSTGSWNYADGRFGLGITPDAGLLFTLHADSKLAVGPCRLYGHNFDGLDYTDEVGRRLGKVVVLPACEPNLRAILNDRFKLIHVPIRHEPFQNEFGGWSTAEVRDGPPDLTKIPDAVASALAKVLIEHER